MQITDYRSRPVSVPDGYDKKGWKRNVTENTVYNSFREVNATVEIGWVLEPFIKFYGYRAKVTVFARLYKAGLTDKYFRGDTVVDVIEQVEGYIATLILERY